MLQGVKITLAGKENQWQKQATVVNKTNEFHTMMGHQTKSKISYNYAFYSDGSLFKICCRACTEYHESFPSNWQLKHFLYLLYIYEYEDWRQRVLQSDGWEKVISGSSMLMFLPPFMSK